MLKNKLCLYSKLMRLDKPVGILLLIWPPFWVITFSNYENFYSSISLVFLFGVIFSRTIGCVVNDFFDKDFDIKVSRTKDRPYAAELVSKREVVSIFLILSILNLSLLFFLNQKTIFFALLGAIFIIVYPLMKRFFFAPQFFLGCTFAISTLMAHTAVTNTFPINTTWIFFFATLIWVTMFDTIYALADKKDDLSIGIKSTAIFFGKKDKFIIGILQGVFFSSFIYLGFIESYSYIFYIFIITAFVIGVYNQILIGEREPIKCILAFKNNQYIGFLIFLGIYLEHLL